MKTRGFNRFVIGPTHLDRYFLSIDVPREQLRGTRALRYVEHGESLGLHERSTFANKTEWYRFKVRPPADLVAPCGLGSTFFCAVNNAKAVASNSYTEVRANADDAPLVWAWLNTAVFWLQLEVAGRSSLGGGLLKVDPIEYRHLPVPSPTVGASCRSAVGYGLRVLGSRVVGTVLQETSQKDRMELDNLYFDILGLTIGEREAVYEALVGLVRGRILKAGSLDRPDTRRATKHGRH